MAQRESGYPRQPDETYETPAWVAGVIADWAGVMGVRRIWEPAPASGAFANHLRDRGYEVVATQGDFFTQIKIPEVDAIVTNPPYGGTRRGDHAASFIRTALAHTQIPIVAMLLPVDYDSGKSRQDVFANCAAFAGKIVLLDRIVFFPRPGAAPSTNHAWFLWSRRHVGAPMIMYGKKGEPDASENRLQSGNGI
jgi:hypothetical protein